MKEHQLLQLKEQVEEAKSKTLELKGERTGLTKQLKSSFNCDTIKKVEIKKKELKKKLENISQRIENNLEKLDEIFEYE